MRIPAQAADPPPAGAASRRRVSVVDTAADTRTEPARAGSEKIARLLREIDALIADDEAADRQITGAWQTFGDIVAAAHVHTWDAYSVDLSADDSLADFSLAVVVLLHPCVVSEIVSAKLPEPLVVTDADILSPGRTVFV